jgi:hypothetical protein
MSFFVVIGHQADVNGNKESEDECLNHPNKDLVEIKRDWD